MPEQSIILDGKEVSKEQFQEYQKDPNIKLKLISENTYKSIQKLEG